MIRARFSCTDRVTNAHCEQVKFTAIWSDDKSSPNHSYSEATPCAHLEMSITNRAAIGHFVPGRVYDLHFVDAPAEAQPEHFR